MSHYREDFAPHPRNHEMEDGQPAQTLLAHKDHEVPVFVHQVVEIEGVQHLL